MRTIAISLVFLVLSALSAGAIDQGPDWKEFGRSFLTFQGNDVTFDAADLDRHRARLRCVKMNNYGCVMGADWNGGVGNDGAGHRVFEHPKWSIRAITRDYCSKHKRNLRSAMQIAEAYSPWCDTLGTVKIRNGWGRTCSGGPRPPASFPGPFCKKPPNGQPSPAQCSGCNCPDGVARAMVRGTDLGVNDDLELFGSDGAPDAERLAKVIGNKIERETGFGVKAALLNDGISLAGNCQ